MLFLEILPCHKDTKAERNTKRIFLGLKGPLGRAVNRKGKKSLNTLLKIIAPRRKHEHQ